MMFWQGIPPMFFVFIGVALLLILALVLGGVTWLKGGMQRWVASAEAQADEEARGTAVVPSEPRKGQDLSLWSDRTDET